MITPADINIEIVKQEDTITIVAPEDIDIRVID